MANWKMTPRNWARLVISFVFLISTIDSGIQTHAHKDLLSFHIFVAVGTIALAIATLYAYWKGK